MIALDEKLMSLVSESGSHHRAEADGPYWGQVDSGFIVRQIEGSFEVCGWSRGATGVPELTGASQRAVEVYLTLAFGDYWRHRQGWEFLRISSPDDSAPPGFDVLEEPDFSADLVIHGDPPVRLGDLLNRRKALEMANALSVPFDDLVASFRDPHGLPAFPQN